MDRRFRSLITGRWYGSLWTASRFSLAIDHGLRNLTILQSSITNGPAPNPFHIPGARLWLGFLYSFSEIDHKDATLCLSLLEMIALVFEMLLAGGSGTGIPPAELEEDLEHGLHAYLCLVGPTRFAT